MITGFWCDLVTDPKILQRKHTARNRKIMAIFSVFFGGFMARAIMQRVGAAGTLGVATGIRVLIAAGWLWAPAKACEK